MRKRPHWTTKAGKDPLYHWVQPLNMVFQTRFAYIIIRNIIRDLKNLKFQMQLALLFPFIIFHFSYYFNNNGPSVNKVSWSLFILPFPSF